MTVERTVGIFRTEARNARALESPLNGFLLDAVADDLDRGGIASVVLGDHLDDPSASALPLRLLGGVHALVLTGRADELARWYPSVGGAVALDGPDGDALATAFRAALAAHVDEVRAWLWHPPQTNEVGRASALIGGLRHIVAQADLPVRLVEVGASAGLNLRADRFRISGSSGEFGDPSSPVQLGEAWVGTAPPPTAVRIVERSGGDLSPIDPTSPDGALRLMAYVWPDHVARMQRLRGALQLAADVPAEVRREDVLATLRRTTPVGATWTVVWHSIFRQYLSKPARQRFAAAIEAIGESARANAPFAHLAFEPVSRESPWFPVVLTTWPGGETRTIGRALPHGLPTNWLD
jgi:hypothetical protein